MGRTATAQARPPRSGRSGGLPGRRSLSTEHCGVSAAAGPAASGSYGLSAFSPVRGASPDPRASSLSVCVLFSKAGSSLLTGCSGEGFRCSNPGRDSGAPTKEGRTHERMGHFDVGASAAEAAVREGRRPSPGAQLRLGARRLLRGLKSPLLVLPGRPDDTLHDCRRPQTCEAATDPGLGRNARARPPVRLRAAGWGAGRSPRRAPRTPAGGLPAITAAIIIIAAGEVLPAP